jgi:hypothetical protein
LRLEVKQGVATFQSNTTESPENPDYVATVQMGVSKEVEVVNSSGVFGGCLREIAEKAIRSRERACRRTASEGRGIIAACDRSCRGWSGEVRNSDQDHYRCLEQAEQDWNIAVEEDETMQR